MTESDEWMVVIALDDGHVWNVWTDPTAIRCVLGPWTRAVAEQNLSKCQAKTPEKSMGITTKQELLDMGIIRP